MGLPMERLPVGVDRPVWVVELWWDCGRTLTKRKKDTKYVRAASEAGAIRTAKAHSMLPINCSASARHATPQDLGCVPCDAAKFSR